MEIRHIASGSKGNAFQINRGAETIQIDCGVKTEVPDHLLLTHLHKDHTKYFMDMILAGVKWWAPYHVAKTIAEGVILTERTWELYERPESIDYFNVEHDVECVGYVIKGDETYCHVTDGNPLEIKDSMKNCTYYGIESNYDQIMMEERDIIDFLKRRIIATHMSNKEAIDLAEKLAGEDTKWVQFIHMSKEGNSIEMAKMVHAGSKIKRRYQNEKS